MSAQVDQPVSARTVPAVMTSLHARSARPPRVRGAVRTALTAALVAATLTATPAFAALPADMVDPSSTMGMGSATSNVALNLDSAVGMVSPNGIGSLLDSSFTMADLDPVSGALMGSDVTSAVSGDYALTADLADSSLLAVDSAELARNSLAQAERARKDKAADDAAAEEDAASGQHDVGPDGCPTSAPANTLRAGSAAIGIAELCANSVAQAPNAQAARAIKYQLNHLGLPYSQPNRMKEGYYDCSSLAMRSYAAADLGVLVGGWAPNTAAIRDSRWAERITLDQTLPGDLVYPHPGHVVTKLSDGFMVHTNRPGDVSHITKLYTSIFYAVRVHPEKV